MILTKLRWAFLKFWLSNINDFLENFKFTLVPYGETKNLIAKRMSDRTLKRG